MLTSFFGKSAPINFLILSSAIFLGCIISLFFHDVVDFSPLIIFDKLLLGLLCIFEMLLLDFIIRKNSLTKINTYGVFIFSTFILMLPLIFSEKDILLSNVFLLLALRRVFSLNSDKNIDKKILDASIWITVAAFFYYWAILFFGLLFLMLLTRTHNKFRHMFIPFVGCLGVMAIATAVQFILTDSFQWFYDWNKSISFNFSAYQKLEIMIPAIIMVIFAMWMGVDRALRISAIPKKYRPSYILVVFVILFGMIVIIIAPEKSGSELMFLFAPLVIMIANYIERVNTFWIKELILWIVLILPILLIMF